MKQGIVYAIAAFAITSPWGVFAQEVKTWTLNDCIRYALEHNIEIKQQEQNQEGQKINLHTSKYSWLPSLNAGIGQNFDFGRSPSKDGIIVDNNSSSTSASVSLNMPIFDGLKIPNDIAAKKFDLKAAVETLNKAKEDLSVNIASYYLQVLCNKELLRVADLQVDLTAEQVERTAALVKAGKVPASQLYDIKAQLARDESSQTEASNNVQLALLDLAQALELEEGAKAFDIAVPEIDDAIRKYMSSILPPDVIYNNAVTCKPQIKAQEYMLESQKKMLKVARASYFPQLNFNASYSNGYYHYTSGDGLATNLPFGEQLSRNGRKTLGFSLSIPLFNRFQVRNSVRSAKVAIQTQTLNVENTKKALYKEIQQAYYNATAAQEQLVAAGKSVEATRVAFKYAEQRYAEGKSNVYEFNEAKAQYAQSLAQEAQAKYTFILRAKILDFYNGTPIAL